MSPETAANLGATLMAAGSIGFCGLMVVVLIARFEGWGGARRLHVVAASRVLRRRIPRRLEAMPGHPESMPGLDDPDTGAYWDLIGRLDEGPAPVGGDAA